MLEESLDDAQRSVSLDKNWAKGYLRLGAAFQVKYHLLLMSVLCERK